MSRAIGLLMLVALTLGCGRNSAGTPCEIEGSGFHARHDCRHKCLSRWQLTCPGGEKITSDVCSGAFGCESGGCPTGQVCYHDDDPFEDRSFCVVANSCGDLDAGALAQWERDREEAQARVRAARSRSGLR